MAAGQTDQTVIEAEHPVEGDQTPLVVEERGLPPTSSPRTALVGRPTSRTSSPTSRDENGRTGAPDGGNSRPLTARRPKTSVSIESGDRGEHLVKQPTGAISQNEGFAAVLPVDYRNATIDGPTLARAGLAESPPP